jgi:hypothetical protein
MVTKYMFPLHLEKDNFTSSFKKQSGNFILETQKTIKLLSKRLSTAFYKKAHKIQNNIIHAYNEKLRCHSSMAEKYMWEAIKCIPESACFPKLNLSFAVKNNSTFYNPGVPEKRKLTFYRARNLKRGKDKLPISKMSFIPFNKRILVGNERYSAIGIPCLYLSNSTEVCFEEITKNLKNKRFSSKSQKLCYSCFDISNLGEFKILDLTYNLSYIDYFFTKASEEIKNGHGTLKTLGMLLSNGDVSFGGNINTDWRKLINYFYIRIIVIATSFVPNKGEKTARNFKPEYVIPQLIMDTLFDKKRKVIGVAYISLQIPTEDSNLRPVNLAFPNFEKGKKVIIKACRGLSLKYVYNIRRKKDRMANIPNGLCHHNLSSHDYYPLESLLHLQNSQYYDNVNNLPSVSLYFLKDFPNIEEAFILQDDFLAHEHKRNITLELNH